MGDSTPFDPDATVDATQAAPTPAPVSITGDAPTMLGDPGLDPTMTPGPRTTGDDAAPIVAGGTVGRYVVLGKLGAGGMGVVYAAYDPELDRKVALKLVLPREVGTDASQGHARLLREAQAMARLSHPNVVAIHDVGALGQRVFLAMDFVEGRTLGAWVRETDPSWRDIVDVFRSAAAGLSAAHQKGLIHRDFKPDNVMISNEGRVFVMDFGLARTDTDVEVHTHQDISAPQPAVDALASELTQRGSVLGTPAYMAPEQHHGEQVDAAADQFAFCVALYEALYGQRPFAGETLMELVYQVTSGKPRAPENRRGVPTFVERICIRGLATEAKDRFDSMDELVAQLSKDPAAKRRRWAMAGTVLLASAGTFVGWRVDHAQSIQACTDRGASIDEVWNTESKAKLEAAMNETGLAYAQASYEAAVERIDEYTARWSSARQEACLSAEVERTRGPELSAMANECLDERKDALAAILEVFSTADAKSVQRVVSTVASFAPLDQCTDEMSLRQRMRPPQDARSREAIREARRGLFEAIALQFAGRYPEGLEEAQAVLLEAERIGWVPFESAVRMRVGSLLERTGDYDASVEQASLAFYAAGEAGYDDVASRCATNLSWVVGERQANHDQGLQWGRIAMMIYRRMGRGDDYQVARQLQTLGSIYDKKGDYDLSLDHHERSLAIRERLLGPDHPDVGSSLMSLGTARFRRGAYDEALALFSRSLEIREATLGPNHPHVGSVLNNIAAVHYRQGNDDPALEFFERALAVQLAGLGPEHPTVAGTYNNIGNIHSVAGRHEQALEFHHRALAIREKSLGPDHPRIAGTLINMGGILKNQGKYPEAHKLYQRALAIQTEKLDPEHERMGSLHHAMGELAFAQDEYEDAIDHYEKALAIAQKAHGNEHPDLPALVTEIGRAQLQLGHYDDAAASLERAMTLYGVIEADEGSLARVRFTLARTLWESNKDRTRALELAADAVTGFEAMGEARSDALAETKAWLAERGGD